MITPNPILVLRGSNSCRLPVVVDAWREISSGETIAPYAQWNPPSGRGTSAPIKDSSPQPAFWKLFFSFFSPQKVAPGDAEYRPNDEFYCFRQSLGCINRGD